jgi:hypothetical protein
MTYVEFLDEVGGAVPAGRATGMVNVRYEAPPDPEGLGRAALGYLKPSGTVAFTHPNTGEKFYTSDQKWVYEFEEAVALERDFPDRWVRAKG